MLAVLYLIVSLLLGYVVCGLAFPGLRTITQRTYRGSALDLSSLFIRFPAWFVIGTMLMTWTAYIGACVFSHFSRDPLAPGNIAAFVVAGATVAAGLTVLIKRKEHKGLLSELTKITVWEWVMVAAVIALTLILMYRTLNADEAGYYVGLSVFSDFTPHISMIRSFSRMGNFPTQYTVCAGSDVKYHFMFTFLVGNLEYLGLRLDHAFNIPSALGLFGAFMTLYALAVRLTEKRGAGLIACLMFAFRSSGAFLYYLAGLPKGTVAETLKNATDFIGVTPHEDWGLWNLNVYCNQRHFAFALTLLLIILNLYIEPVYEAARRIAPDGERADDPTKGAGKKKVPAGFAARTLEFLRASFLSQEGWLAKDIKCAVCTGVILGALGFWNGAVLIATVTVLFFLAIFADRRLEYLIIAIIAGTLSLIQTRVFIDGNALGIKYQYGFLAENTTVFGSVDYLIKLLGILPVVLVISFLMRKAADRYVLFAFSTPLIFAFCISMTPDIAVNHKYVMISVMLMGIFAAWLVVSLFERRQLAHCVTAVFLVFCLTVTGIYDLAVVLRRDRQENSIILERNAPVTEWISANCSSKDLFLTSNYYLTSFSDASSVILSGASLYNAWEYFGWSAGYDTGYRDMVAAAVYGAADEDMLKNLIDRMGFDYVIIDRAVREHTDYTVNEMLFDAVYPVVFTAHDGMDLLKIYKVSKD